MTRRRTLYLVAGLSLVALCGSIFAYRYANRSEAERVYDQIKIGMEPDQVERIIGRDPEGWFPRHGRLVAKNGASHGIVITDNWRWDDASVTVTYDQSKRVCCVSLFSYEPTLFDRLTWRVIEYVP